MNILYVGFFELPDKDAAANRVMNNAKALVDSGHNVIFIDEKKIDVSKDVLANKSNIYDMDVWSTLRPVSIIGYIKKMISIKDIINVIKQYSKIDLIITYNYPAIALYKLRKYCVNKNIKLVSDCTEWYSGKEYTFPKSVACAIDSYLRMNVIQKNINGIICISSYLEEFYENQYTLKIPPLVDIKDFECCQNVSKFSTEKLNLVYAGNPGKSKEFLLPILEAINKSKNKNSIVFRIVGLSKEQFNELYPNSGELLNSIKDSVVFFGRLPHVDTLKIIGASDYMIFIRPHNRVSMAGFSTKFVEAISCGTSVITTDTGDLKTIIENTDSGLIINNEKELVNYLNEELTDLKEKAIVKNNGLFDYRRYSQLFGQWLTKI